MKRALLAVVGLAMLSLACATGMGGGPDGDEGGRGPRGYGGALPADAPRYVNPGTLAALDGFTHAVKVGFTIYVSGEVPLDSTGALVGAGDVAAQAKQAFANLGEVLKIAGARPGDVTKLTIYVVSLKEKDIAAIRSAAGAFLPERNPPAGTIVGVSSLPRDGVLIAVDAIAVERSLFEPRTGP
ncbi:MAG TPA: RidA family protein [Gemmatimonadales bacterium]|nr:RidA family protein [Gemmatimonadales bacterium]